MDQSFKERYLAARQEMIAADFSFLNPEQRRAVMAVEGPLLLLAGAGSGKTTVLINRIVNLVRYGVASESRSVPEDATEADIALMEAGPSEEARARAAEDPVQPWRILAITFTNKAADELKRRLEQALGSGAEDVWAQTFHSACVRILRRDGERLGFTRNFTIYDSTDSLNLVKRIIRDQQLDEKLLPPRYVLSVISKAKDAMQSPEEFQTANAGALDVRRRGIGQIYQEYAHRLQEADAMDFDDLLLNTVLLLRDYEDVRSYYQRKFQHVLVDEYQDTNRLQYLLASTLAGGYENICVVGDDDQSIYKFRGATIQNILEFQNQYQNARVIRLEQNYRSTGHILEAANGVIGHNRERMGKQLWTAQALGEKPLLHVSANEREEARFVADKILEDYSRGIPWGDHAVLYRMNAQSNQLEYAFKSSGIPYRVYGGMKFFDRAEIKDVLAYLSVLANPADDLRLLRIINTPARGIGPGTVDQAVTLAAERGVSVYEILKQAEAYPELRRNQVKLRLFTVMLDELREKSAVLPLDQLYDELLTQTGYLKALEAKDTPENAARMENIKELKTNILGFIQETGDSSLHGFLDEVALYTDLDQMDGATDCVTMMTIHSAKGLEFPVVFLVGVEEGIFPGQQARNEPADMEEERRLCYVAITRAMQRLYITRAKQRMLFGRTGSNRASRFLAEIPPEHLEMDGWEVARADANANAAPAKKKQPKPKVRPVLTPASASAPVAAFQVGDAVRHRSFGSGTITAMTPMGGDFLVEIDFASAGRKRVMLKAAARLMVKE